MKSKSAVGSLMLLAYTMSDAVPIKRGGNERCHSDAVRQFPNINRPVIHDGDRDIEQHFL